MSTDADQRRQDDVNARLFKKIDDLTKMVSDMRVEVVEVKTTLTLRKDRDCPSPGLCMELQKTLNEHSKVIEQARGGWKVIVGATISSGLLGAVFTAFLTGLFGPKH